MTFQNERLQIIQNLSKNLWMAYVSGQFAYMEKAAGEKLLGKDFVETLEFFLNKEYAKYKLEKDIDFPTCIKPDYFLHLMQWSEDFKHRNKNLDKKLIEINLDLIVFEKRRLLRIFGNNLTQVTVDRFEDSFQSKNEDLNNYQRLIFKLVKRDLSFEEDLISISRVYFNALNIETPEILTAKIFNHSLLLDLKETQEIPKMKI